MSNGDNISDNDHHIFLSCLRLTHVVVWVRRMNETK